MAATIVQYLGTGRRKRSVARVFLRPGKGEIKVNHRAFENYFPTESARAMVRQPLAATETVDKFDILILADGGGCRRTGGRRPSGRCPGFGGVQRGTAVTAEEAGLSDPRPARARAEEVRPEGRAQAVPVLQTLNSVGPGVRLSQSSTPSVPPAGANLALDRAGGGTSMEGWIGEVRFPQ